MSKKPAKKARHPIRRKSASAKAFIEDIKAQLGRPKKLAESDELIKQIKMLAGTQHTQEQAAAFLSVSDTTFRNFLRQNPRSAEAWEMGKNLGLATLRQLQWRSALQGNVQMQIWLGINWLGQSNRVDTRLTGENDVPVPMTTTDMKPAEAAAIWEKMLHE